MSLGELSKYLEFEKTSIPMLVESQKVNVCFLKTSDIYIELIEPIGSDSPVKKISESGSQNEAFSPVTGSHFDMTSKDLLYV